MASIRDELQRIKHENHGLEDELRSACWLCIIFWVSLTPQTTHTANSNVEQKARLLESKVAENAETIEQLRRERSLLVADHKNLQKQFTHVSEVGLFRVVCLRILPNTFISARQQAPQTTCHIAVKS